MFRKALILSALILLIFFTLPSASVAASDGVVVKVGQNIYVQPGENYDALVGIGSDIKVDGIANTVVSIGGDIEVNGDVQDAVVTIGGDAVVNKAVYGDLVIVGGSAFLANEAIIHGDLVMVGVKLTKEPGAQIKGAQTEVSISNFFVNFPEKFAFFGVSLASIFFAFTLFATMLMTLLVLLVGLIFPQGLEKSRKYALAAPGKAFLFGLLLTIFFLPISFVLLITIIGIPLLLLFWLVFGVLVIWGLAVIAEIIGEKATSLVGYKGNSEILKLIVGILLLVLIIQIPIIGWIILFFAKVMAIGISAISHLGFRKE